MMQMEETILKLREFSHNHHHSGVKMVVINTQHGISGFIIVSQDWKSQYEKNY
jgi:hypothetical protein